MINLMNKTAFILTMAMTTPLASAESIMKPFNGGGYGTVSGCLLFFSEY